MHAKKNAHTGRRIALITILVLLALAVLLGGCALRDARRLLSSVDAVEESVFGMIDEAKAMNMDGVEAAALSLQSVVREDEEILDGALWRMAARMPGVGGDVRSARKLIGIARQGVEETLLPALSAVRQQGDISAMLEKKDIPALLTVADNMLTMADGYLPRVRGYLDEVSSVPTMRIGRLERKMEKIRSLARMGEDVLPFFEEELLPVVRDELLPPLRDMAGNLKMEDILPGEGKINAKILAKGLDALEGMIPALRALPGMLEKDTLHFSDTVAAYTEKISDKLAEGLALYDRAEPYLPLLKKFLAGGEDRLYLFVAQNSAEIRACGGFPGAVGFVRIQDGVLSIDEFNSVYRVLKGMSFVTQQELDMFTAMVAVDRDAVVNPYFPIVATRWAENYEKRTGKHIDGVISASPIIIQDLLEVAGPVELSDGTVLDGSNAVAFLQNGIYLQYLQEVNREGGAITDALFSETAALAIKGVFRDLGFDKLERYLSILERRFADRVIMLWLEDEEGEELIRKIGCDGGFNTDPEHPQLGVYFSNYSASKLGWYLDLDVEMGKPWENEDGSLSYPVTVSMANTLRYDDIASQNFYIVAATEGSMTARLYLATPAGGELSDFYSWGEDALFFARQEYYDCELYCTNFFHMGKEQSTVVSFTVTTAPGVREPLSVITTPTLSGYRR